MHVQYQWDTLPLIISYEKKIRYIYGPRKLNYCYSQPSCNVFLYKIFYESYQDDTISYTRSLEDNSDNSNPSENIYLSEEDNDNDSSEPEEIYFNGDMFDLDSYDNEIGYIRTHNNDDDMLTREYLETSMTHTVPTEGMLYQPEELNINGVLILYPQ